MTEPEYKQLQQLIRKEKSLRTSKHFFYTTLIDEEVNGDTEFKAFKERYRKAKSLRGELTLAKVRVIEWTRTYERVGLAKKDWARGVLEDKIQKLAKIKKEFKEL